MMGRREKKNSGSKGGFEGRKDELVQIEALKGQLARALADYDNLRKRTEAERSIFTKIVSAKVVARMLPIFDMLEEAQKHLKDSGIALILEEFKKILRDEGIERIKIEKGSKFDENLHEVVEVVPGENKGGIVEEVLSGWKFVNGEVIRPAKVKVYGENPPAGGKKEELEKEMARGEYV